MASGLAECSFSQQIGLVRSCEARQRAESCAALWAWTQMRQRRTRIGSRIRSRSVASNAATTGACWDRSEDFYHSRPPIRNRRTRPLYRAYVNLNPGPLPRLGPLSRARRALTMRIGRGAPLGRRPPHRSRTYSHTGCAAVRAPRGRGRAGARCLWSEPYMKSQPYTVLSEVRLSTESSDAAIRALHGKL